MARAQPNRPSSPRLLHTPCLPVPVLRPQPRSRRRGLLGPRTTASTTGPAPQSWFPRRKSTEPQLPLMRSAATTASRTAWTLLFHLPLRKKKTSSRGTRSACRATRRPTSSTSWGAFADLNAEKATGARGLRCAFLVNALTATSWTARAFVLRDVGRRRDGSSRSMLSPRSSRTSSSRL